MYLHNSTVHNTFFLFHRKAKRQNGARRGGRQKVQTDNKDNPDNDAAAY